MSGGPLEAGNRAQKTHRLSGYLEYGSTCHSISSSRNVVVDCGLKIYFIILFISNLLTTR